jgi:hypothetical protein
VADGSETVAARRERRAWIAVWVALGVVTLLAIHRLHDFPAHLSWLAAFAGMREVIGSTAWAAAKVWSFWGLCTAVLAGLALRFDPELEQSDALLIGAAGPWVIAYALGNLLGPFGLFNTATAWGLLALGAAYLWRHPPRIRWHAPTSGQKLAALAVALLAVSMVPLQFASPVAPFMDVLSYASSVARILTFHLYLPFDNDPYGAWGPQAQTPGLELFLALLGFGGRVRVGALAQSAAMFPIAALMIFGAYRLGKTLFGDTAGGIAALFLFWTCLFRRAQGVRGTAVDFALIGLGLAFFLDRSRRRTLVALGALLLGGAVASHTLNGACAMIVASVGVLLWLVDGDVRAFLVGTACLAGATLTAVPDLAISLAHPLAYPLMAGSIVAGTALIVAAVSRLPRESPVRDPAALRAANIGLIALFICAVLYRHAFEPYTLFGKVSEDLPMLFVFAFGGLVAAMGLIGAEQPLAMRCAGAIGAALALGIVGESLDTILRPISHSALTTMMVSDITIKLWDYWCPYFLTFPAGLLFALAYQRWSRPLTFFALLIILIYPWYQIPNPIDYDSVEHSITEQWAFNLNTAAEGYWAGHTDRRWTFGAPEMGLLKVLEKEIAAGRITVRTHILHLCENISSWSLVQFPIFTGINDDPIEIQHDPRNLYEGGSRVRGMTDLPSALARRPSYILSQIPPPPALGNPPVGYDLIFDAGWLKLWRRHDLASINSPPPAQRLWRWSLGAILLGFAMLLLLRREHGATAAPADRAHRATDAAERARP